MKKLLIACGLLLLATVLSLVGAANLQAQRPGSRILELETMSVAAPTTSSMNGMVNHILGRPVRLSNRAVLFLKVIGSGLNGTSTLKVYFQNSCDDGQTFNDFATVSTTGSGTWYIPISAIAAGPTTVTQQSSGTMASNTATQGPVGNLIRVKYDVGSGTGGWSFQAGILYN